jgi:MarR family transcriptional regulator for hemolysin
VLRYDFDQSVIYWICSTAHALERALNVELAPHGITYRQWQVLAWLALEGELTQSDLADRLQVEAPTLAGILDRMERDGWILRTECPGDRRRKRIKPTERVAPVWETIAAAARRIRTRAATGQSPEALASLIGMLQQVQASLGVGPAPGPAPEVAPPPVDGRARRPERPRK